jgi:hypothetical protein
VFVRILQGRVADEAGVRAELDRWRRELVRAVPGWRRLTAGVADGRELVAVFGFDDEDAARRGADHLVEAAGQTALERHLVGRAGWHDCRVVHVLKGGDLGGAGFVRVVQGRMADPVRLAAIRGEVARTLRERAPHVVGALVAEHTEDPGGFTEVTWFTSERETRAAERQMPVDVATQLGTVRSFMEGLRFLELREPLLARPPAPAVPVG